jgi:hypothetical protein
MMARLTIFGALLLAGASGGARAQDDVNATTVGPTDLTRATQDAVEKLVGVWRVDRIEGQAPEGLKGRSLRIDRQSVATLTLGTCTNPSFAEHLGSISVACVGQNIASAAWDPQEPGRLQWSEAGFQAVLRRISGTETLDSPPPAEASPPESEGDGEGTDEGTGEGTGDAP